MNSSKETPSWKLYYETPNIWQAMLAEIDTATETIDFEQFYFSIQGIGQDFINALAKKAAEGVKVRMLLDSFGSFNPVSALLTPKAMKAISIELVFFNWLRPLSAGNHSILYFRNHRRSLIIDKKIAFTGGVCIADEMKTWRETAVKVTDVKIAQEISIAFEEMWYRAQKRSWRMKRNKKRAERTDVTKIYQPGEENDDHLSYMTSAPLFNRRYLYYELVRMIRRSRSSIFISTPYFLPDNRMTKALVAAARRGVRVTVLIPKETNHLAVQIGAQTYFEEMLKGGVEILRYPRMIHAKTTTIDDMWSMVGSFNMDNVSLRYNFESAVTSTNPDFAKELVEQFKKDTNESKALTLSEWRKRPFTYKVLEFFIWPLRKFL